jgi:Zn-dependent protease with chaperone function
MIALPYLMKLYLLRLLCLSLASFYLVHAALGLAAWLGAPSAIRLAEGLRPRVAARFLLVLRLLPAGLAMLVVAGLCVPSYLWLEPASKPELIGLGCWAAALLCVAVWAISIVRMVRAASGSLRYGRRCRQAGHEARVSTEDSPMLIVEGEAPLVALAGVIRPRIVISSGVLRALSREELGAALSHERAHRTSRDNLKRLLLLLAPEIFPFSRGFASLERAWARFTEWAADDRAVAGDSRRSLSLAAALVRVARMGAAPRQARLLACLVADRAGLSARVDRLLRGDCLAEKPAWELRALTGTIAVLAAGILAAAILQPATFYSVHRLLEHLIH